MKRIICAAMIAFSSVTYAQQWIPDLETGLELAQKSDRRVLLLFSVADGCQVCQNLESRVFADMQFIEYANSRFVLVREDFSEKSAEAKLQHLAIVEKYNRDGFFPLVLILDSAGRVLKKTGPYEGEDARSYIGMLEKR